MSEKPISPLRQRMLVGGDNAGTGHGRAVSGWALPHRFHRALTEERAHRRANLTHILE
jgi:hypothetical protein